ncbi:MAG: hypothetical protein A3F11_09275 [Gammaproteobacteria bacterium RIFCSPHIGHO2_12_FULL_37_14]|nr:MAG: hypothetical protein A3F11_09275 [Gammaproteobacteria bacterium RIFCSPHIGHO2_12_FULL_37_14]
MKKTILVSLISIIGLLSGCASIVSGTSQRISVSTAPAKGASCSLENNKGKWYLNNTPGTVTVNRSFNDLQINCKKPGYTPTFKQVASNTKGMVFGNAVFGGILGAGIDMADGAAYEYPQSIDLPMRKHVA